MAFQKFAYAGIVAFTSTAIGTRNAHLERKWLVGPAVAALGIALTILYFSSASAQTTLNPDVNAALQRFTDGTPYANRAQRARDQALLFANNDAINAARLNNEISDSAYQAAQSDFDKLNTKFGQRAAHSAGADFTVQQRPAGSTFSPGTDSDYITIVKDKDQIGKMQADYNKRVNEFLTKNGAIDKPRDNWQTKLDTDFMADPRHVSEADFREIAKMNNDAYKRGASANFERISRQSGGGKIGPEHVTAYTEDMADFTAKKQGNISEMFKNPSNFNDPAKRAKVIQMMAQEQKYISRMEALDDYLRKQEGLPPRNRGVTIAKQGSIRDPSNVKGIKDAHRVASSSQASAVEDLVETMTEVAKKNPDFAKSSADDIAKIIAQAPAEHRGAAIAKLTGIDPDLAKAVKKSPNFGAVDDLVRTGDKITDATKAGGRLTDAAEAGIRQRIAASGVKVMETIGKVGAGLDVAVATSQLKDYYDSLSKAMDPSLTDEEADKHFDRAASIARTLTESGVVAAITEASPAAAAAWGTWLVSHHGTGWLLENTETGQKIVRVAGELVDWDAMADLWVTQKEGHGVVDARNQAALCDKIKRSIAAGRMIPLHEYTPEEICAAMKREGPAGIRDMYKPGTPSKPTETAAVERNDEKEKEGEALSQPSACKVAENHYAKGREAYSKGDADAYTAALNETEQAMDGLPADACGDLVGKIAKGREQADMLGRVKEAAGELLGTCKGDDSHDRANRMRVLSGLLSKTDHPYVRDLKRRLDAAQAATLIYARAKHSFDAGDLDHAEREIPKAQEALEGVDGGDCPDLREAIDKAPETIAKWREPAEKVEQSIASCNQPEMSRYKAQLSRLASSNSLAASLRTQLDKAADRCRKEAIEVSEAKEAAREADRLKTCRRDNGPGYQVGHVLEDGRFFCVPNQETANAWCMKNWGSGHYAVDIDSRGGFSCLPTKKTANATCRQEHGSGWYAGKVRADGTFLCHPPRQVRSRRKPSRPSRPRGPSGADVGAAIGTAIIQGIIESQRGGGGGRRRCHRNPYTGQVHCGSN